MINGRTGRPKQHFKKVHPPRIKLYEDTIEKLKIIAEESNRSQSDIYQEALDQFILNRARVKNIISL